MNTKQINGEKHTIQCAPLFFLKENHTRKWNEMNSKCCESNYDSGDFATHAKWGLQCKMSTKAIQIYLMIVTSISKALSALKGNSFKHTFLN